MNQEDSFDDPSSDDPSFVYCPLDPETEEIRLLTLHPASKSTNESALECTLHCVPLLSSTRDAAQIPPYESLSYVWGEPDFSSPILLNGQIVHVTPNLAEILRNLRDVSKSRTIWVDAVCINQADLVERARQVQLMHKIYSSCQRVLAWMGPLMGPKDWHGFETPGWRQEVLNFKRNNIVSGMRLIREIVDGHSPEVNAPMSDRSSYPRGPESFLQLSSDNEVPIVSELLKHSPYWKRVWVVQELVRAPQISLVCGDEELDWKYVASFLKDEPYFDAFHSMKGANNADHNIGNIVDFGATLTEVKQIEDQRRALRHGTPGSSDALLDVLARFRNKEATDPRDKIYAMIGLLQDKPCIEIDYTSSLVSLYRETTLALMQRSKTLDIICQNPFESRGLSSLVLGVPKSSWVANFGLPSSKSPSILFAQREIFSAGAREFKQLSWSVRDGEEVLILTGSIIDTLSLPNRSVSLSPLPELPVAIPAIRSGVAKESSNNVPSWNFPQDFSDEYSAWRILQELHAGNQCFQERHKLSSPTKTNSGEDSLQPESSIRAFWRTIVRDCTAPPMMRRLTIKEIEKIDIENTARVESQKQLLTWQLYDKYQAQKYSSWISLHGQPRAPPGKIGKWIAPLPDLNEDFIFATTLGGLFVLTRRYVDQGDVVAVLDGGKVPVILRRVDLTDEDDPREAAVRTRELYRFVCVAYVHGIMDGEVEEAVTRGWVEKREIMLV